MGTLQLNLHQVISFYFLAKEESFSRAAERLSITQPAVTQHIHGLEVQFGVKLVSVKKKRVYLTEAGEKLLPYAEEIFNQAVQTENFLKGYRYKNISIGIASPLVFFFTDLINHFKELHPSVRVSIQEGSSRPLVEQLLDLKLDICLIGVLSPYKEQLRLYRIRTDLRLFFVASPEYPLPSDKPITWAELISHPLIINVEGSSSRALLLNHLKRRGLKPLVGTEVSNVELAKELARQKKGIALMFETNIQEEIARGSLRVIQIEDGEIKMGAIHVVVNRQDRLSPTVESFLSLIRKHFKDNLHEMPPQ